MTFVNEYKNRGGRVCTGSDAGFIYKLYGFDYIRELDWCVGQRTVGVVPLKLTFLTGSKMSSMVSTLS